MTLFFLFKFIFEIGGFTGTLNLSIHIYKEKCETLSLKTPFWCDYYSAGLCIMAEKKNLVDENVHPQVFNTPPDHELLPTSQGEDMHTPLSNIPLELLPISQGEDMHTPLSNIPLELLLIPPLQVSQLAKVNPQVYIPLMRMSLLNKLGWICSQYSIHHVKHHLLVLQLKISVKLL